MNTMNFLRDNRKKSISNRSLDIFWGLVVIVIVIFLMPVLGKRASHLDAGMWNLGTALEKSTASIMQSKKSLLHTIDVLEERINALEIERLQFDTLLYDNKEVPTQIPAISSRISALITTRPRATMYDFFMVDRGSDDGVEIGKNVYVYNTLLFGEVVGVQKTTATVRAYSSSQQEILVYHNVSESTLNLIGRGNGNFQTEVPQGIDIIEGDVLLAEESGRHVVGVVEHIISDEREPFKQVYIRIPANINGIQYVQIDTEKSI